MQGDEFKTIRAYLRYARDAGYQPDAAFVAVRRIEDELDRLREICRDTARAHGLLTVSEG